MIFSLFKKKKEDDFAAEKSTANNSVKEVIKEWDNYLEKEIKDPSLKLLEEAREGSSQIIDNLKDDLSPLLQAWGAIEHKMNDYYEKALRHWNEISDKLVEIEEVEVEAIDTQGYKLDLIYDWLKIEFEKARVKTMFKASEKLLQKAKGLPEEDFTCTQCAAKLNIGRVYRAQNIKCQYCSQVNSYEPGRKRLLEQKVLEIKVEHRCLEKWVLKYKLESELEHLAREKVTFKLLQDLEKASRDYWESYYFQRVEYFEHERKFLESNIQSRMDVLYRSFKAYKVWTEKG